MALFIQNDAAGAGGGTVSADKAFLNLAGIANGDTGLGQTPQGVNRLRVTYAPTLTGPVITRLNDLVGTSFSPDYGSGPQNVDIVILAVESNFVLNDGSSILTRGGTALPPQNSGLGGSNLNTTGDCLVIYDTTQNNGQGYCTARAGSGGTLDLPTPNVVILYHELSHAFRIVNNGLLTLGGPCNPSSPEENAAITEENDLRTQIDPAAPLRDPGIHCGALCGGTTTGTGPSDSDCCIVASVATGSPISREIVTMRGLRDDLLRRTEVGHIFFQKLFHDYYDFSPQVATTMAGRADLPPLALEGYVRPLITILRLIRARGLEDQDLGAYFAVLHSDPEAAAGTRDTMRLVEQLYRGDAGADDAEFNYLRGLMRERAWPSEHVRWGLVEPIVLYAECLEAYLAGTSAPEIGVMLDRAIGDWSVRMPIDPVWGALSARELRGELEHFDTWFLKSPTNRAAFRRRLLERFPGVSAIREEAEGAARWQ